MSKEQETTIAMLLEIKNTDAEIIQNNSTILRCTDGVASTM